MFTREAMTPDPFYFIDFPLDENGRQYTISKQTYVNMIGDHLCYIVITGIIAFGFKEKRKSLQVFFWLMVVNLFDYLLTYNAVWFHLSWLPVSCNTLMITIFGLITLNEWIKSFSVR